MKKALIVVTIFIIYFVIYFLQVNFFSWFTIAGVKPNLFVLLVLFIGLFLGGKPGAVLGFIIGLYTDFLFSGNIGVSAMLFGIVGISGAALEKRFSRDSKITILIVGSIVTALYEVVLYIYSIFAYSIDVSILSFLWMLGVEILYNAMLLIIFYPLLQKYGILAEDNYNNNNMLPKYF